MLTKEQHKQRPLKPENYLGWLRFHAPSRFHHFFYLTNNGITCLCGGYHMNIHNVHRFLDCVKNPYEVIQGEELYGGGRKVQQCFKRAFDLGLEGYPLLELKVEPYIR